MNKKEFKSLLSTLFWTALIVLFVIIVVSMCYIQVVYDYYTW